MPKSKRESQKENTRKKIIESAFKIYSEKGFTAATSKIAKDAGVAHGSLFLHFPTLKSLLLCLVEEFGNSVCAKLSSLAENDSNIEELLDAHIDILSEHEDFYARLITETALLPKEAQSSLAKIQYGFAFHFHRVINHEIESGVLKKLPANILFNIWAGLLNYYLQNRDSLSPGSPVLKRYKRQLIFTYCELLRRQ